MAGAQHAKRRRREVSSPALQQPPLSTRLSSVLVLYSVCNNVAHIACWDAAETQSLRCLAPFQRHPQRRLLRLSHARPRRQQRPQACQYIRLVPSQADTIAAAPFGT